MITVGIPVYNEASTISSCIFSILPQLTKKDEVIVVASGCTDDTEEVVGRLARKHRQIKLLVERERKGKASAINLILKKAKFPIVVQTDGDVMLEKSAIKNLLRHFKNKGVGAVSGNPVPLLSKHNLFYDWTFMSYKKLNEIRISENKRGVFWHLSGYLCAFRKKALDKLPVLKGAVDAYMGSNIKEKGFKLVYEPKARVFVKAPTTVKDFVAQKARVRAGFYNVRGKFGKQPRTLQREIFYLPKELLKLSPLRWPAFLLSGFIYFYAWIKGWWLFKTKKPLKEVWRYTRSTKI